jgi:hypothetical protein
LTDGIHPSHFQFPALEVLIPLRPLDPCPAAFPTADIDVGGGKTWVLGIRRAQEGASVSQHEGDARQDGFHGKVLPELDGRLMAFQVMDGRSVSRLLINAGFGSFAFTFSAF